MEQKYSKVNLFGRVIMNGQIQAKTGLHIGGSQGGIDIGGIDNYIIRDPLTMQPYIPGSSIKGKLRSLLEKRFNLEQNNRIGRVYIHTCQTEEDFKECKVCPVFGIAAKDEKNESSKSKIRLITLTRIVVRDAHLDQDAVEKLKQMKTDLQYSEVKTEVVIDRLTSAAVPRTMERVPAGAVFNFEIIFSLYDEADPERFMVVPEALKLLEDDYLGGLGTRGSGQVQFQNLKITGRKVADYSELEFMSEYKLLDAVFDDKTGLQSRIKSLVNG